MRRRDFLQACTLAGGSLVLSPANLIASNAITSNSRFRFITASDGHYGQPNTDYQGFHNALIKAVRREGEIDFVVFNGDLIHDDPKWMPEVKKVFDSIGVPYYPVKGNHDRISEASWQQLWGVAPDAGIVLNNDIGIVLANSSNEQGQYLCVNKELLGKQLETFRTLPHVFVFIHISQNDWTRHGVACPDNLALLADYPNVRAVFHGHDHDVDGMMVYRKKPFLWSGHFGGNWGNPFPCYRLCEIAEDGKVTTCLKTVADGIVLNKHTL